MKNTPIPYDIVKQKIKESNLPNVGRASIRELVRLVNEIEAATGIKYVRMEMGVPGLEPSELGINAEIEALKRGVASKYPMIDGVPELKKEVARFVKNFINIDVNEQGCIPTVGSMQGAMAAFLVTNRCNVKKDTVLFIDPGFPVQKQQLHVLGMNYETFDVYNYRGEKLRDKLESYLQKGNISTILYSNPNNPSWICFTDTELQIIGELANKYDIIVIEDLAYFAMDFRKDLSKPGEPPFQPTVANYTNNWLMLISSSKAFSYAGQRIGVMVISNQLYKRKYPDLKRYFTSEEFGYAMLYGAVYSLSSGVCHSTQYGLAAMLKAANEGTFNFVETVKEYGEKAKIMKKLFTDNGFKIVYDKDEDKPLADGFYFTISYPGLSGEELLEELLYYGISAISLAITGSERTEGLRACVSQVQRSQFPDLEERLKRFNEDHKNS
ncbi:aminotransferase class I/II-fold pyridoxal phosphate-dependent enzyme [Tenuifilum thalassicum]|uniref:Pyridoxal phosphate-dependent aminotransferase n=1 Tax=Tenuifilum thalassicum TaxID=2590900 RepID=A0A7D4BDJ2_9BACT|nr:pyridoxal phosphate-dependent aminotransferase [Tenuifilum thalassicum]QKG79823.1 pyridoxal phosphate-dependent aminotransferase [Tenuifilum thalassicum]